MTKSEETPRSDITSAAARMLAPRAMVIGSPRSSSRTRVLRITLPDSLVCCALSAPASRVACWASKKAAKAGCSAISSAKVAASIDRVRVSSIAMTPKTEGLSPSRVVEPKQVPLSPRSTNLPLASRMSTAPDRTTYNRSLSRPGTMIALPRR